MSESTRPVTVNQPATLADLIMTREELKRYVDDANHTEENGRPVTIADLLDAMDELRAFIVSALKKENAK